MFTVATVNVNGLRAAGRKGFLPWLTATAADVVCLQEVRAAPADLPAELGEPAGWHTVHAPGDRGRNGVAVYSRVEPDSVAVGIGSAEFDDAGRYLEAWLPGVVVASLYLPNGDVGTERQAAKERFLVEFFPYLVGLRAKAAADNREVLVCGDWNIAHRPEDLKAWRANRDNSGFLPHERAWLDEVYDTAGYVDVVRRLHPDTAGPYTWWSYRGKAYDNDAGWRIDLHVATPGLARQAVSATVDRAPDYASRWSDHAPVTVAYDR